MTAALQVTATIALRALSIHQLHLQVVQGRILGDIPGQPTFFNGVSMGRSSRNVDMSIAMFNFCMVYI